MPFGAKESSREYWIIGVDPMGLPIRHVTAPGKRHHGKKSACPNNTARADNRMRRIGRKVITSKNITT
jgi:hypothetical protein